MPPKPIAPATIVSQTWGLPNAESSRRPVASGLPGQAGTKATTMTIVRAARAATSQYDARQPRCWPRTVAIGTPTTLATGSPSSTHAIARPRRSGATMLAATRDATPKNPPCGSPSRNRATTSISKFVATALSALKRAYAPISTTSSPRRGHLAPKNASTGAPTTTPSA